MDTETLTCKVCEARADYGITQQLADGCYRYQCQNHYKH